MRDHDYDSCLTAILHFALQMKDMIVARFDSGHLNVEKLMAEPRQRSSRRTELLLQEQNVQSCLTKVETGG